MFRSILSEMSQDMRLAKRKLYADQRDSPYSICSYGCRSLHNVDVCRFGQTSTVRERIFSLTRHVNFLQVHHRSIQVYNVILEGLRLDLWIDSHLFYVPNKLTFRRHCEVLLMIICLLEPSIEESESRTMLSVEKDHTCSLVHAQPRVPELGAAAASGIIEVRWESKQHLGGIDMIYGSYAQKKTILGCMYYPKKCSGMTSGGRLCTRI